MSEITRRAILENYTNSFVVIVISKVFLCGGYCLVANYETARCLSREYRFSLTFMWPIVYQVACWSGRRSVLPVVNNITTTPHMAYRNRTKAFCVKKKYLCGNKWC